MSQQIHNALRIRSYWSVHLLVNSMRKWPPALRNRGPQHANRLRLTTNRRRLRAVRCRLPYNRPSRRMLEDAPEWNREKRPASALSLAPDREEDMHQSLHLALLGCRNVLETMSQFHLALRTAAFHRALHSWSRMSACQCARRGYSGWAPGGLAVHRDVAVTLLASLRDVARGMSIILRWSVAGDVAGCGVCAASLRK